MTCIYCPSTGPFTDEHVVPAGLGGDDRGWLLKDVVCEVCNTGVFSPLETKVMRASPLSIPRLFMQSRSRNRGAKTAAPTIQASVSYFDDPETGLLLEQELGSKGQSRILPQIVLDHLGQLGITADTVPAATALVDELASLDDLLTICVKRREGSGVHFDLTPLTWQDGRYLVGTAISQQKAPSGAIWLEPLVRPATDSTALLTLRLFQRANGPLVCRADSVDGAARLLTLIRINRAALIVSPDTPVVTTEAPGLHIREVVDPAAYDRVLTKIGVNLCAHLFGADAVRTPAFDSARAYARTGTGIARQLPPEITQALTDCLPRLVDHHLFVVTVQPPDAGCPGRVMVRMQFYGGPVDAFIIAEGHTGLPDCPDPIYVVVDYEANAISRFSSDELAGFLVSQFGPDLSGWAPGAA